MAYWSGGAALADTERSQHAIGQLRLGGHERDDEAEQADTLDVLVHEDALHGAIGEVHDANERTMIDERKADERARGEQLVANERMMSCLRDVLPQGRLARSGDFSCHTVPDR